MSGPFNRPGWVRLTLKRDTQFWCFCRDEGSDVKVDKDGVMRGTMLLRTPMDEQLWLILPSKKFDVHFSAH